jgi:hypothetical protein
MALNMMMLDIPVICFMGFSAPVALPVIPLLDKTVADSRKSVEIST